MPYSVCLVGDCPHSSEKAIHSAGIAKCRQSRPRAICRPIAPYPGDSRRAEDSPNRTSSGSAEWDRSLLDPTLAYQRRPCQRTPRSNQWPLRHRKACRWESEARLRASPLVRCITRLLDGPAPEFLASPPQIRPARSVACPDTQKPAKGPCNNRRVLAFRGVPPSTNQDAFEETACRRPARTQHV